MTTQLATTQPATAELYRQATDVAGVCREIVLKTAMSIQGRQFVRVEGWSSIATAHGCIASVRDVVEIEAGVKAIAEIRRISDGTVLCSAEGFVGRDEPTWYGGEMESWDKKLQKKVLKMMPKRPDYAIRAMAQTRAVSRACRAAFSHVVVMMDAGLSTTPAEEVPEGGFDNNHEQEAQPAPQPAKFTGTSGRAPIAPKAAPRNVTPSRAAPPPQSGWRAVKIHFGKKQGVTLGELARTHQIQWWLEEWQPKEYKGSISPENIALREALDQAMDELSESAGASEDPSNPSGEAYPKDAGIDEGDRIPF